MFSDKKSRRELARWVIGVVTACLLVYLAIRHIASLAQALLIVYTVVKPMILGIFLALIFDVPMEFIENRLLKKYQKKGKRVISITLALILVFGIFLGVFLLVIPALGNAITLLVQIARDSLVKLSAIDQDSILSRLPVDELANMNIDWNGIMGSVGDWVKNQGMSLVGQAMGAAGSVIGSLVTALFALTFALYMLAQKETLCRQVRRLTLAWLPRRVGETAIHVVQVCAGTFKSFVAGQVTEAIILGTLCMLGMLLLQLPYAPMVGALVGVTALIPIVGAWIGAVVGAVMILTISPIKAVIFVVYLLILQQIEGNLIYPKVVGSKLNLPAIWVLAAITIGGNLAGPFGMLLGVPAASAAYMLLREATSAREAKNTPPEEDVPDEKPQ